MLQADLTDVLAIHALKARYFRTMDSKDWDGLRACFADDLIADFRQSTGGWDEAQLIHGADAYLAMIAPMLAEVATVHHGHMPEIEFTGADEASGIWAMEDKLWVNEGSALPFKWLHGYGHYHEQYRKDGGVWRIAAIKLTRLRVDAG
ncbi:nuclear transport factor 2 family protein [Sphingomonas sp. C3-2]|uniref:nuclear transport factor 2 family protein n=1 Tax=Sphingomonas sp. C3-2 TaxID=3062169 RepID=UPI00294B2167|nr:nuclear transport factor 2 family protein [Sphingomonas sp. C3-2]WOK37668.1 nuclear transport factor 2 family protein [Sphingomonas sp. C3-2]